MFDLYLSSGKFISSIKWADHKPVHTAVWSMDLHVGIRFYFASRQAQPRKGNAR